MRNAELTLGNIVEGHPVLESEGLGGLRFVLTQMGGVEHPAANFGWDTVLPYPRAFALWVYSVLVYHKLMGPQPVLLLFRSYWQEWTELANGLKAHMCQLWPATAPDPVYVAVVDRRYIAFPWMEQYYDTKNAVMIDERDMPAGVECVTYNLTVIAIKEWKRLGGDEDGTAQASQGVTPEQGSDCDDPVGGGD